MRTPRSILALLFLLVAATAQAQWSPFGEDTTPGVMIREAGSPVKFCPWINLLNVGELDVSGSGAGCDLVLGANVLLTTSTLAKTNLPAESPFVDEVETVTGGWTFSTAATTVTGGLTIGDGTAGAKVITFNGNGTDPTAGYNSTYPGTFYISSTITSVASGATALPGTLIYESTTLRGGFRAGASGSSLPYDLLIDQLTANEPIRLRNSGGSDVVRIETDTSLDTLTAFGALSVKGANAQKATRANYTTALTGMTGATVTATNLIPAGCLSLGVTLRVTTLITGATSFDIGDGTDIDRWGAAIAVAAGTTTTIANFTVASWTTPAPPYYTAATSVVLTANGANFTAGAVRVDAACWTMTAATS